MQSEAAEKFTKIIAALKTGKRVMVFTALKATIYDSRHIEMFKLATNGLFVQRGKSWDCIDYAGLRFEK